MGPFFSRKVGLVCVFFLFFLPSLEMFSHRVHVNPLSLPSLSIEYYGFPTRIYDWVWQAGGVSSVSALFILLFINGLKRRWGFTIFVSLGPGYVLHCRSTTTLSLPLSLSIPFTVRFV